MNKIVSVLTKRYSDTRALVLIGSYADGTYNGGSDIDIVWFKTRRIHFKVLTGLEEELGCRTGIPRVQLIPFTRRQMQWHFKYCTTMAHALQNGKVLYGDEDKYFVALIKKEIALPRREWMNYWFAHWQRLYKLSGTMMQWRKRMHKKCGRLECDCDVPDDIVRVIVNFAILDAELHGTVPTSKTQLRHALCDVLKGDMLNNVSRALAIAGRTERMTIKQADVFFQTARRYSRRLIRAGLKSDAVAAPK